MVLDYCFDEELLGKGNKKKEGFGNPKKLEKL